MEQRLIELLEKAFDAGEAGAELLVKQAPLVAEQYLNYLVYSSIVIQIVLAIPLIFSIFFLCYYLKKQAKNLNIDCDDGVVANTIFTVVMSLIFLAHGVAMANKLIHVKTSPTTAIYYYLLKKDTKK